MKIVSSVMTARRQRDEKNPPLALTVAPRGDKQDVERESERVRFSSVRSTGRRALIGGQLGTRTLQNRLGSAPDGQPGVQLLTTLQAECVRTVHTVRVVSLQVSSGVKKFSKDSTQFVFSVTSERFFSSSSSSFTVNVLPGSFPACDQ